VSDENDDELSESFPLPEVTRLYKVKYLVKGRKGKHLLEMCSCMIGNDVGEIVDAIRSKLLGSEINGKDDDGNPYFETVDAIDLNSIELIAPIHGTTEAAYNTIKHVYESSTLFPLVTDETEINEPDDDEESD
jgi:hypothetical protein